MYWNRHTLVCSIDHCILTFQPIRFLADFRDAGVLDCMVGNADGTIKYFENIGTSLNPEFVEKHGTVRIARPTIPIKSDVLLHRKTLFTA